MQEDATRLVDRLGRRGRSNSRTLTLVRPEGVREERAVKVEASGQDGSAHVGERPHALVVLVVPHGDRAICAGSAEDAAIERVEADSVYRGWLCVVAAFQVVVTVLPEIAISKREASR